MPDHQSERYFGGPVGRPVPAAQALGDLPTEPLPGVVARGFRPARSGVPRWLTAVIGSGLAVVVLAVVAAVAIPIWRSESVKAAALTVRAPAAVGDLPVLPAAALGDLEALADEVRFARALPDGISAGYGSGSRGGASVHVVAFATPARVDRAAAAAYATRLAEGVTGLAPTGGAYAPVAPGRWGGEFGCLTGPSRATACYAVNDRSWVTVVVLPATDSGTDSGAGAGGTPDPDAVRMARDTRDAVVTQRP